MKIKGVRARVILDSRGRKTIEVFVNGCKTSAPSGESRGAHETPSYRRGVAGDAEFINKSALANFPEISSFSDLEALEKLIAKEVGANTLFALEASILKALAKSQTKELWQILNPAGRKVPLLISNIVGGGVHSRRTPKPDFQEFLVVGNKKTNLKAYEEAGRLLGAREKDAEHAWAAPLENEQVLELMKYASLKIGIDAAASQFYKDGHYYYKHKQAVFTRQEQINYMIGLIKNYRLSYVEDPLNEEDFQGFAEILRATSGKCLIVGDDLTATHLGRLKKAIEIKAINGMIVKPNQTGSLLEVKRVIDLCRSAGIKTIMSHRSEETMDSTISDLAVAWGCDYMKIPVAGRERLAKVERLEEIERRLK